MARVTVGDATWSDHRFGVLQETLGWSRAETLGALVLFWSATRDRSLQLCAEIELMPLLPGTAAQRAQFIEAMTFAGYVQIEGPRLSIIDNEKALIARNNRRAAAAKGGAAAAKIRKTKKKATQKLAAVPELVPAPVATRTTDATVELNRAIWTAYSQAFLNRYHAAPPRNAKVNALVMQLGKRLGHDAPAVAVFYCDHTASKYTSAMHCMDLLVRDAEALQVQCATQKPILAADSRRMESTSAFKNQLNRLRGD